MKKQERSMILVVMLAGLMAGACDSTTAPSNCPDGQDAGGNCLTPTPTPLVYLCPSEEIESEYVQCITE
jgi:hypothetical protein